MVRFPSIPELTRGIHPFIRRTVAFLLLSWVTLLVVDPIWECRQHLDNLRHLGPHGVLLVMLIVALAGVSLFKSVPSLLACGLGPIAIAVGTLAVHPPASAACSPAPESRSPLRI
jgi:hypothetical protein